MSVSAGTAYVDLRPNLAGFNRQLQAEMSGPRMRRMGALGGAAIGAGLTVAATKAFQGTVGAAAQFETAFSEVRKTVDTNARGFVVLERGIRRMARTIPIGADELSDLAGQAGALGIRSRDLLRFTRTAAELGIATDLSSTDAANALARLSNIMGTSSRDFRRLGSTFVRLGNEGASTEREIADMALRIAGAGKQIGLSEAEVLSYASALSSVGIEAEAGGSAISRVFIRLATASREGGRELATIARVAGVSSAEFRRAFEQNAAQATLRFITGLDRMKRSGEDVFGTLDSLRLSEIRVRDALLRASSAGELFNDQLRTGNDEWRRNAALTREANERYRTSAARYQKLRNQIRDFGITLGQEALPKLNELMDILTSDRLTGEDKFERLSEQISTLVSEGLEKAAEQAVEAGPHVVAALGRGILSAWDEASPLAKLFTVAALMRAVGGRGAIFGAGTALGRELGAGISAGAAASVGGAAGQGGTPPVTGVYAGGGGGRNPRRGGRGGAGAPGRGGRLIYGDRFRYGAPTSQLGPRPSAATRLGGALNGALMPAARVTGAAVGIALADDVLSTFNRRVQEKSPEVREALVALTKSGWKNDVLGSNFNALRFLPGVGSNFEPQPDPAARRVLAIWDQFTQRRITLNQLQADSIQKDIASLNLTREQRAVLNGMVGTLREASRLRIRASIDDIALRPRLARIVRAFATLRDGSLSNLEDIDRVSRRNMARIANTLGLGTARGKKAAAENMRATADAIHNAMLMSGNHIRGGVRLWRRLIREADLMDPTRAQARAFAREWAKGLDTTEEVTRRGIQRMIAEAKKMPRPMQKVALETFLAQIDAARRSKRLSVEEYRAMRSRITAAFGGINRASRDTKRIVPGNVASMVTAVTGAAEVLGFNLNRTLEALGVRRLSFSYRRVTARPPQKRQRGGTITPVPGVGSGDKVPALLEPGEVVVNREAVRAMGGPQHVNKINSLIPRFQTGGIAGGFNVDGARPGFVPFLNFLNRMFGPIYVMSGLRPGSITTSGNVSNHASGRAVDISTMQNGLNQAYNAATLNATGVAARRMDALYGYMARWIPTSRVSGDFLWRTDTGGNHWNHIHRGITNGLADSAAAMMQFLSTLPEGAGFAQLKRLALAGPDGPLKQMGQAAIDRVWRAANDYITARSSVPMFGTGALVDVPHGGKVVGASTFGGPNDPGTGSIGYRGDNLNGKDAYAELRMGTALGNLPYRTPLTIAHGGRAVRAEKLDIGLGGADVQGHSTDIDIWHETARKLGLPDVWKGLVSISGMRLGGIVQQLQRGGIGGVTGTSAVGVPRGRRRARLTDLTGRGIGGAIGEMVRWLRRPVGRGVRARVRRWASELISEIGVKPELQARMTELSNNADTWAEFAQRANALSYELVYAERTPVLGPNGLPELGADGRPRAWHEPGDPILDADRRPMTHWAQVNGRDEGGWMNARLGALFELRNKLVEAADIVRVQQQRVAALIRQVRERLKRIQAAIRRAGRQRRRLEERRKREEKLLERERSRLRSAERELESATGSLRTAELASVNRRDPRSAERRRLRVDRYGRRVAALQEEIPRLRESIRTRQGRIRTWRGREDDIAERQRRRLVVRRNLQRTLGDESSGLLGRRASMDEYLPEVLGSGSDSFKGLVTVQGLGGPVGVLPSLPPIGVLGGEIFDVQQRLREIGTLPDRVPAPEDETAAPDTSERDALRAQLDEEWQRRYIVSQAQFRVFEGFYRDFPLGRLPGFGGSFATGGVVPGAVGEARTIIAHGGERVLSVAEQRAAGAGAGDGTLRVLITDQRTIAIGPDGQEVRAIVRDETRKQALVGRRGMPGLAGAR